MKKRLFLYLMPVFVTTAVHAQQISGIVKDDFNNELTGAVASLLRAKDSTVVDQNISVDGKYSFAAAAKDSFLVRINNIGFETTYSLKFYAAGEPVVLPTMILRKTDVKLKDVVVSVRKPMVETKPDKIVLNVEGTINATGTDALELLRKSPGVMIDKDDQLSVNGKNGVQVYIDGRPSPLSSQDLSNYLKSLSSSQIEAIEIITNPSSQYEAAGTAGVINIRLKKNKSAGFNGNISTGINVSCHTRVDDGISLNYRNNKLNVYGSYNGAYGNTGMDFNLYRSFNDTTLDQKNKLLFKNNSHNFKAGADYTLNAKNSLGLMVNGSFATPTLENTNYT
ncbi:MAG: TonB-dependent receptor plug domain-containing protein, partial [Flavipsychrobacter sp.]